MPHSGVTKPHHPCDGQGMGATGFTHSLTHIVKCQQTWPGEHRVANVPDLEDILKRGSGGLEGMGGRRYRKRQGTNRHIHNASQAVCAVQKAGRGPHRQTPQMPSSPCLVSTPHTRSLLPSAHSCLPHCRGDWPHENPPPLPFPFASPSGSDDSHRATLLCGSLLTWLGLQYPHLATQGCMACLPPPSALWTEFIKKERKERKGRRERKPPLNLIL